MNQEELPVEGLVPLTIEVNEVYDELELINKIKELRKTRAGNQ